jgi:hypothetical protein
MAREAPPRVLPRISQPPAELANQPQTAANHPSPSVFRTILIGVVMTAILFLLILGGYWLPTIISMGFAAACETAPQILRVVVSVLVALIVFALYMAPTIDAVGRNHPHVGGIGVVNFFFGWTGLGWVLALIWSASIAPGGNCCRCNARLNGNPDVCQFCGTPLEWLDKKRSTSPFCEQ